MRILITAGGTREYIDPVRYISNASSGRMGYALAREAIKAGHKVTLVTAPTSLRIPRGVQVVEVETTAQMFEAVKKNFDKCDCLIMAAAVADYTPYRKSKVKIKKHLLSKTEGSKSGLTIRLKPTVDILKWAGRHKKVKGKKRIVVGFALEDRGLRKNAEKKLKDKNLDMIVANTSAAVGSHQSTVHIRTTQSDWEKIENTVKIVIAKRIIDLIQKHMSHA
jgi:phosphopantothenoylcysteine decarboxylase/phosphopantothenate--cysteine ligase